MDILAPFVSIDIVTPRAGYGSSDPERFSGTSALAPHVSGAIALLRSEFYENSLQPEPEDYENMLKAAALDLNWDPDNENESLKTQIGYDNVSGWGQLKIGNIFEMLYTDPITREKKYKLEHFSSTDFTAGEWGAIDENTYIHKEGKMNHKSEIYKTRRRTITSEIDIYNQDGKNYGWISDINQKLFVWGRSGQSKRGGLSKVKPLYLTGFTEVIDGLGGNEIVNGIIHDPDNNNTVTVCTYQYKVIIGEEDDPEKPDDDYLLPANEDIELFISVFGVSNASSINENINNKTPLIFPNPAIDLITIRPAKRNHKTIEIYTLNGIKLLEINSDSYETKIPISDFQPGIYFVRIGQEKCVFIKE